MRSYFEPCVPLTYRGRNNFFDERLNRKLLLKFKKFRVSIWSAPFGSTQCIREDFQQEFVLRQKAAILKKES